VAQVIYARHAARDLDRLVAFADDVRVIDLVAEAIEILEHHPYVGRVAEEGLRELVISLGKTGYVALYDYDADDDIVVIMAIRHQREAGYEP